MPSQKIYEFGPFRFGSAGFLTREGKRVHLRPKQKEILHLLLKNHGSTVKKEEFRQSWPEIRVMDQFENCLKRAINPLREALQDTKTKDGYQYIETVSKAGYRFVADVRIIVENELLLPIQLAVLPFKSLTRTKQPDYFIDGLTHEIITQLGRLNPEQLAVIAPISAMLYKTARKTARQIGEELGVQYVVIGAVLRSGNQVRISVHLIHVADERQAWAETYDRKLTDILVFLREVCQDIARKIEIKLVPHEQARLDYVSPVKEAAYDVYLQARYLWNKRTPASLQEAILLFEKAIALDPGFALAHSGLADGYAVIASQSGIPPKEACAKAQQAATCAIEIDRALAEPHAALGFVLSVFQHQWAKGEREFDEALRLNGNHATAHHWYSFYFAAIRRMAESVEQIRAARQIDPHSRMINTNWGTMLYWNREYDAAIQRYDQALKLDPDFWYAYWMRGMAFDEKRQYSRAIADHNRAMQCLDGRSPLLAASLARSLALSGNHKEAGRTLKAVNQPARNFSLPYYHFATAYAALGNRDAAFHCLFESHKAREMWISFIQVDPKIDSLRQDPKYAKLHRMLFPS